MRRLHTADWRSRTATARLPRVLARTVPDAKAFAMRVLGRHPNNFAEHSSQFQIAIQSARPIRYSSIGLWNYFTGTAKG
jgi:hypothetical protein